VLKAIEQFAVECSVNKVFTSEALAYVVDEALQVYGGNGYSREFPAERAYRDARITRIYEGTNEINRLIIATRLLKQGLRRSEVGSLKSDRPQTSDFRLQTSSLLEAEHALLGGAKRLALALLGESAAAYGDAVRDEQEVLGHIANLVIEIYAIESGLARTEKIVGTGGELAPVAVDCVQVFASDAADRIVQSAKQVVRALASRGRDNRAAELMISIAAHPGVDTVLARRRIADAVIRLGRHPF
jgi:butyryl-CoA dehydrogenase